MRQSLTKEHMAYREFIEDCAAALGDNEFWCIVDPDGCVVPCTVDKRLDQPVIIFCDAANCDWDDATDAGFRLSRCRHHP